MSGILLFHFHWLNRFSQFFIYEDSAAVFTRDDFLALTDIELTLSGDLVVATAAGIAIYGYYCQAVASVLADALEGGKQTIIDTEFELVGTEDERLSLLFGLQEDIVEFCTFLIEFDGFLFDLGDSARFVCCAGLEKGGELFDFLLSELNGELLKLNLLGEVVVFAVVANVLLLVAIAEDSLLGVLHLYAAFAQVRLAALDIVFDIAEAGLEAFYDVGHVFYFLRKLTLEHTQFVDFRIYLLQFVERMELLFYSQFVGINFLCHIVNCF